MNLLLFGLSVFLGLISSKLFLSATRLKEPVRTLARYAPVSAVAAHNNQLVELRGVVMAPPETSYGVIEGQSCARSPLEGEGVRQRALNTLHPTASREPFYIRSGADVVRVEPSLRPSMFEKLDECFYPGDTVSVFGRVEKEGGYIRIVPSEGIGFATRRTGEMIRSEFEGKYRHALMRAVGVALLALLAFGGSLLFPW